MTDQEAELRAKADRNAADIFGDFTRLLALDDGWNGPGSIPVSLYAWREGRRILARIFFDMGKAIGTSQKVVYRHIHIVPLSDGGLHLIIGAGKSGELTVEVDDDAARAGSHNCLGEIDGKETYDGHLRSDEDFALLIRFMLSCLSQGEN